MCYNKGRVLRSLEQAAVYLIPIAKEARKNEKKLGYGSRRASKVVSVRDSCLLLLFHLFPSHQYCCVNGSSENFVFELEFLWESIRRCVSMHRYYVAPYSDYRLNSTK